MILLYRIRRVSGRSFSFGILRTASTLAVAMAIATSALSGASAEASGGRIAFTVPIEDRYQIETIEPDGSDLTRVAGFPEGELADTPRFSPDGRTIAFRYDPMGTPSIQLMDDNGSDMRSIAGDSLTPSWAPDGTSLLLSSDTTAIESVDADGSHLTVLAQGEAGENLVSPVYSPDESKIAYARGTPGGRQIHVMNADGTEDHQITDTAGDISDLSWSPDGTELLYYEAFVKGESPEDVIHIVNADGTDDRVIGDEAIPSYAPVFSPDGSEIAFSRYSSEDERLHLYVMDADGSDVHPVPNAPPGAIPGSWTSTEGANFGTEPPSVACETGSAGWHATNVSLLCTASDPESGLAEPGDASFTVSTQVYPGEESPSAATPLRQVCDGAAGCVDVGPFTGFEIDRKAPSITIEGAEDGLTVPLGAAVTVKYHCTDEGSGVASCSGTLPSGSALDTSTLGEHSLSVTAVDAVGNEQSQVIHYSVVVPTYALSGHVSAPEGSGLGLAGMPVTVTDSATGAVVANTNVAWDDSYSVELPAGTYDVAFTPDAFSGYGSVTEHEVVVTAARTLDVEIPGSGSALEGTITYADGRPDTNAGIEIELGPEEIVAASVEASGHYRLPLAAGTYEVRVIGSSEELAYEVHGVASVFVTGNTTEDFSIPAVGSLDVSVVDQHGAPIQGASIEAESTGQVELSTAQGTPVAFHASTGPTADGPCTADDDGNCTLHYLVGVPISLLVTTPSGSSTTVEGAASEGGNTLEVRLPGPEEPSGPTISCAERPSGWSSENVSIPCTASDTTSELANPADASFSLSTSVGAGEATANASTNTREVCDQAGICTVAGPISGIEVDRKAPTIAIEGPEEKATVPQGAVLLAHYTCSDVGSGLAACEGSTANGQPLDTSTLGTHVLSVTATDAAGNRTVATAAYTVVLSGRVDLASSENPSVSGAKVSFTATIHPERVGTPTPTGTVTYREGSTVLGTVTLTRGSATFATSALSVGEHPIAAVYSGDANNQPAESAALTEVVHRAQTSLSLTSSANPAAYGSSATLKAIVKVLTPGHGTPTGTVTFAEGETALATVTLSKGSATYHLATLPAGQHTITATYSGDEDFEAGEPALFSQTVQSATTQLSLTSSANPAVYGSSATLKAVVKVLAPGHGTPTGTVTFAEGKTILATVALSNASATYHLAALPAGQHTITVTYTPDTQNFAGTSAPGLEQAIEPAGTKLTLTRSANPAQAGSGAYVLATVKAVAPGTGTPTGAIVFSEGETVLATVEIKGGTAEMPVGGLGVGEHAITASYGGDSNFLASLPVTDEQTIKP